MSIYYPPSYYKIHFNENSRGLYVDLDRKEEKMKEEDLKVGMIFEDIYCYYKIIYLINNGRVLYLIKDKRNDNIDLSFGFSFSKLEFFNSPKKVSIIDKVPTKIEEVEEEVSVYITKEDFKSLQHAYPIYGKGGVAILSPITELLPFECVELCKIKRKVKKELNFSWEKNIWE